jgi:hypothetical protein
MTNFFAMANIFALCVMSVALAAALQRNMFNINFGMYLSQLRERSSSFSHN